MSQLASDLLNNFEEAKTSELLTRKGIVFLMHLSESGQWAAGEAAGTFNEKFPNPDSLPSIFKKGLEDGEDLLVVIAADGLNRTNRIAFRNAILGKKGKDTAASKIGF